ncbi:class I SAM-dependent methyltransferase [Kibdelosporangium aridum]|uniref:Class I SAM-dependent methyltransferase n=1 Tax=Kibdelosporangium aridum TaxID=2030 RepID=A0A428Z2X6_KIBAR|nr:class I SAM-dependent methyltransferase [Kibdelosporangium aridum]RSM80085.1 class I SAM-dependent methyltransferase [Kibdelosporangium aridum]
MTLSDTTRATNQHYELPAGLFTAYLDRRLKYSSGLFESPETTLDDAQTAKLHFVARQLGISGGEHVLDVGCGWGSLILFMAVEFGCTATGVTPSATQVEHITKQAERLGVADRIHLRHGSFSDIDVSERFDAVTMLGSIIHMPNQTEVLTKAYGLLHRGGSLYLSESCFRNKATYDEFADRPGTMHVTEGIFGFADMVPVSSLVESIESAGFSLTGLTDLTAHYHETIARWEENALSNRDEIERILPGYFEPLVRYLRTANAGWGYTSKHYGLTAQKTRLGPKGMP